MNSKILFVLLLLPGLAQAVICKTVGADGVTSFTNVLAAECPQGSDVLDYGRPKPQTEQAGSVDTGISGRRMSSFAGYESIEILSPADDGTVRSNEGRVPVLIALEPGLQQSHFITAYLDGKAFRGRYGSSEIVLNRVDRGTHQLRVKVSDSSGKTLIESRVISFTVMKVHSEITVAPITGDDYVDASEAGGTVKVTGTFEGAAVDENNVEENLKINLRFPVSGWESDDAIVGIREGTRNLVDWSVEVPGSLLASEASFDANARINNTVFKTTSTHSVDPQVFKGFANAPPANYSPGPAADFRSKGGNISTTPSQTNPAFKPNYGNP